MAPDKTPYNRSNSDALFREIIRKNFFLISMVFLLIVAVSLFLYKNVAETSYLVKQQLSLERNSARLNYKGVENQRFLRLLKQRNIRVTLIKQNNLASKFNIDTTHKNALYKLDKALIDHLKVEEQHKGEIQIRFISESIEFSRKMLDQLTGLALTELNKELTQPVTYQVVFEKTKTLKPKFFSILFLISAPVMLFLVIFIAIKQKLYFSIDNE